MRSKSMLNSNLVLTVLAFAGSCFLIASYLHKQERQEESVPVPPPQSCVNGEVDQLCSEIPHDITEKLSLGYSQLTGALQRPFDNFSWQTFIALNWPAESDGTPLEKSIGTAPDAPRVWQAWETPASVFKLESATSDLQEAANDENRRVFRKHSKSDSTESSVTTGAFHEATGQALIDRNLNYVVYDIVLNPVEVNYIVSNNLDTKAGQEAFRKSGKHVSFPTGYYTDNEKRTGGSVGAIEVKTAWRILVEGVDDFSRYHTVAGVIPISAADSASGKPFVAKETLGLVGFHVIQRTRGPAGFSQDWVWSTFEHVDNAPLAGNAQDPRQISTVPTAGTTPGAVDQTYSFYNPKSSQSPNQPPPANSKWAASAPYAIGSAFEGKYGTQVVRCWKILPETQELNSYFQGLLKGTVWENYQLVATQWQGGVEDPSVENGNIPRYLSNTTQETYIQFDKQMGSCIQCHGYAKTAAGQDANFSFQLQLAK